MLNQQLFIKLNSEDMSQLKVRKRLGKTPITCPCCKEVKTLDDTPLITIFQKQAKAGVYREKTDTVEALNKVILSSIDYYAGAADEEQFHQYKLWACNQCVKDEKAIIANFSKQQPSYGGPYIMYLDLMLNCKYCDTSFCFSAREQQYWYEELQLTIDAKATRCEECRKKKVVQQRLMVLLGKEADFTEQELEELIECYEMIGSKEKVQEYRGRLKNRRRVK